MVYDLAVKFNGMKKTVFLNINDIINIDGVYYTFLGDFDKLSDAPNSNCIFTLGGDAVFKKQFNPKLSPDYIPPGPVESKRKKNSRGARKLRLNIHPKDNEQMVLAKSLSRLKDCTVDEFKQRFGPDNTNEMNNMKYALENSHSLSHSRFIALLKLFNYSYKMTIYQEIDTFHKDD